MQNESQYFRAVKVQPDVVQPLLFPEFYPWLGSVPNNAHFAFCNVCSKKISLSNMGKRALTSHMGGKKTPEESRSHKSDDFSL